MATDILENIVQQKEREIEKARSVVSEDRLMDQARERTDFRPFFQTLCRPGETGVNIIAEIKRASPSKGDICVDLDAAAFAENYDKGGAAAISVLTDSSFFKGSLDDLKKARAACSIPVLRKEFIIDSYQVVEAAAAGADAILLIARILTKEKLAELYALCRDLKMDALVEIHTPQDAAMVADSGVRLVGINNRNLKSFHTDISVAMNMVSRLASDQVAVAASGISGHGDIQKNLDAGIFNFLVGESIVRSGDPVGFIQRLMEKGP